MKNFSYFTLLPEAQLSNNNQTVQVALTTSYY